MPSYPYAPKNGVIQLPWECMYTFMLEPRFGERVLGRGTCFSVSRNGRWFIVTNRHNVTGHRQGTRVCINEHGLVPDHLVIALPTNQLGDRWWGHAIKVRDDDWSPLWVEHPTYGGQVDVVALAFDRPPQAKVFGALLDDLNDFAVTPGDVAHALGYRRGEPEFSLFPQWIECAVQTPIEAHWEDLPRFLVQGDFFHGSSGSPVLAYREDAFELPRSDGSPVSASEASRLLGIYSGRVVGAEDLGVVWNLGCVREVVDHALLSGQSS